jgi:hypothetical protein
MFIRGVGNWVEYRELQNLQEIDFHPAGQDPGGAYYENMAAVRERALSGLIEAQANGFSYLLFKHGWSTSHRGKTTSRSQVRSLMRSKEATPFIIRSRCIQHYSVFVAAIRSLPPG